MKRREVEIFMAVKEVGDIIIEGIRQDNAVMVDYEGMASDINMKFNTSPQLKGADIKKLIDKYIYNNCIEFRERGAILNNSSQELELVNRRDILNYIFHDFIACGGNKIIRELKANKNAQAVLSLALLIKMVESDTELNGFNVTMNELEDMLNDYIESNCDTMKIEHKHIDGELHLVVYSVK